MTGPTFLRVTVTRILRNGENTAYVPKPPAVVGLAADWISAAYLQESRNGYDLLLHLRDGAAFVVEPTIELINVLNLDLPGT